VSYPLIVLLADGPKNTGPDFGKASPVGLFIVVLLLIAVFALVWSMNRHLKKARAHFAAEEAAPTVGTSAGSVGTSAGSVGTTAGSGGLADDGSPATREPSGESGG
jgi:hypothetical protein